MCIKAFFVFSFAVAAVNAGYLEPALRYAASAPIAYHAQAPIVSHVSPAVTKTDFIPGSYSSSYRNDVITPRVKYTETPGYSYAVPQPPAIGYAPTVTKVASLEPVIPALPAIAPAPIARIGYGHGIGYAGAAIAAPLSVGHAGFGGLGGLGYAGAAIATHLPAAHTGFGLATPFAGSYGLGYSKYGAHF